MKYLFVIFLLPITSSCVTNRFKDSSVKSPESYNSEYSIKINTIDAYDTKDGYYIFYDKNNSPSQKIIFFIHGYGAINPAIYGKWIKHLVGLGCVVIYPRYQKTTNRPKTTKFPETMSKGLLGGFNHTNAMDGVITEDAGVYYFGHSYGGAGCLYFGLHYAKYGLPKPKGIFACQPGTGPKKGMVMEDYSAMEEDIDLVVLSSENDLVVRNKMAILAHNTANVKNNLWIEQFAWSSDSLEFKADHSSPCSIDSAIDNGIHNSVYKLVSKTNNFDEEDIEGYFKISEELLKEEQDREWLFKDMETENNINSWSDSLNFVLFKSHLKINN